MDDSSVNAGTSDSSPVQIGTGVSCAGDNLTPSAQDVEEQPSSIEPASKKTNTTNCVESKAQSETNGGSDGMQGGDKEDLLCSPENDVSSHPGSGSASEHVDDAGESGNLLTGSSDEQGHPQEDLDMVNANPASPSETGASQPKSEDNDGMSSRRSDEEDDAGMQDADSESVQSMSDSESGDSDASEETRKSPLAASLEDVKKRVEEIMAKPKPKHTWSLVKELHKRQVGDRPSLLHQDKFRLRMYSSLHAVERLELMAKLCGHEGCVNCLHFNAPGSLLASGSDDLNVIVWDWQRQRPAYSYNTGHKSNIFEAKFMPLHGDTHIVSTSRDGQVRLAEISPTGECRSIRRLAQHRGSGRKLALQPDSPHNVLSCGEDAVVFNIDIRQRRPQTLLTCIDNGKNVSTNSIAAHPEDGNMFLLACVDKFVRLYDRRMIGGDQQLYRRLCPHGLLESGYRYSVTCGVFNYNGTQIAASYNDEDIYLFDASHSDGADAIHQYSGHRNNATIKGVNFYGPTSKYIVSGSDCGNVLFWDRDTEAIVQCMPADDNGVVNCLEPHPHIPVLATSGLDDDVKIWVPSRDTAPDLATLKQTVETNLRERLVEDSPSADSLGGSLMWTLMQQVFGAPRRRRRFQAFNMDSDDQERSSDSDDDQPGDCRPS